MPLPEMTGSGELPLGVHPASMTETLAQFGTVIEHKNPTKRGTVPAISTAALFAVVFLLANVPGNPVIGPDLLSDGKYGPHFECSVESVVHGWPFSYLRHDGRYAQSGDRLSAWRLGNNVQFAVVPLVVNVLLLVGGIFAIGWIVERRIHMHGWRFGLIHLMMAMLAVSAALAFIAFRYRLHQAQISHLHRVQQDINFAEWQPFGPHWLRDVTGPWYWQWGDHLVAADIEHSDDITELSGKNAIKVLRIFTVTCDAMPPLDEYDNLTAIDMCMVNYDDSEFDDDGDPDFCPCLRVIAQRDSLQGLNLYENGISDRGLEELVGMPNLTNLELSANPSVTDNGLVHLASIQSLRKLSLWGTSVTRTGVEKLQIALPECEIGWDGTSN